MGLPPIQSLMMTPGIQSVQYPPQRPDCHPVPQLKEVELQLDPLAIEKEVAEAVLYAGLVKHSGKEVERIRERSNHWPAQNDAFPCFLFLPTMETEYSRIGFPGLSLAVFPETLTCPGCIVSCCQPEHNLLVSQLAQHCFLAALDPPPLVVLSKVL